MPRTLPRSVLLLSLLAGCAGQKGKGDSDDDGASHETPDTTDTQVDDSGGQADDTGEWTSTASTLTVEIPQGELTPERPELGDFPGLVGVPNRDDDDGNGDPDWEDAAGPGDENDLASFTIDAPETDITLSLEGDGLRLWFEDGSKLSPGQEVTRSRRGPLAVHAEFEEHLAQGELTITAGDEQVVLALTGSPLFLNHHLQTAEHVWALSASYYGVNNTAMLDAIEAEIGGSFTRLSGRTYGFDVWVQDELEFGSATAPEHRMDVVIDSIRDRGLDPFPENDLEAPDSMVRTWGSGRASTYDSFGNMEASPPVTVDGVEYPFGRIYYGAEGRSRPTEVLTDFLAEQIIQAPVEIDTSWLAVGHVDEFTAFIPDPGSEKGFKFVFASVDAAYELLDAMDGDISLTRYASATWGHGIADVEELRSDSAIRSLNEDIQSDILDPILEKFKREYGLTDADIILMPSLFEEIGGWGGSYVAALIPGMVNLMVYNPAGEGGGIHLFMADPFLRTDIDDQDSDPLIAAVRARFPKGVEIHFVDDWDIYHMGLGEVHCGTNVRRTPVGDWWNSSRVTAAIKGE